MRKTKAKRKTGFMLYAASVVTLSKDKGRALNVVAASLLQFFSVSCSCKKALNEGLENTKEKKSLEKFSIHCMYIRRMCKVRK